MRILGINAVFHDPAAALVVDGEPVAAAEEERFTRRKHGKPPVPFAAWEQPERSAAWCIAEAGLRPSDVDIVGFSYDPGLVQHELSGLDPEWEHLRTEFAGSAPRLLRSALPGLDPDGVRFVPHHVAHAASAGLAAPFGDCAVLTADGRGESTCGLLGQYRSGRLEVLAEQSLPGSLGLLYESLTAHLGFRRSSDEYDVMALAGYAKPTYLPDLTDLVRVGDDAQIRIDRLDWSRWAPPREPDGELLDEHAQLAASVQTRLEELLLELAGWLHRETGQPELAVAGGVALNCVANTRLAAEGPFDEVWVQPAAGDAGTALGAAMHLAAQAGERVRPMPAADLGRGFGEAELESALQAARLPYERPDDVATTAADSLARNEIVGWFQGRAEFGPRALGHRSLLAHPGHAENAERLNEVKGSERFRPVAPVVLAERAAEIFDRGPVPSPFMLFVHDVRSDWRQRIPAVVHVDGTARIQTVDRADEPLLARLLGEFAERTGLPTVINTSFNTAGRPMVDSPADALECFGSSPIDLLVLGPFVVRRAAITW